MFVLLLQWFTRARQFASGLPPSSPTIIAQYRSSLMAVKCTPEKIVAMSVDHSFCQARFQISPERGKRLTGTYPYTVHGQLQMIVFYLRFAEDAIRSKSSGQYI
jgi:hypothetical protein